VIRSVSELPKETLSELLRIERTLWENNDQVYHETYVPDALLIFPGVGRIDRETAVTAIQKENAEGRAWAEVQFDDAVGRSLMRDTAVLISYCATARWIPSTNAEIVPASIIESLGPHGCHTRITARVATAFAR
jgi:hypothetical protein